MKKITTQSQSLTKQMFILLKHVMVNDLHLEALRKHLLR